MRPATASAASRSTVFLTCLIEICGDGDGSTSESLGHHLDRHTGLQGEGRVSVTETVEGPRAQVGQPGRVRQLGEATGERGRLDGCSIFPCEDQTAVAVPVSGREPFLELAFAMGAKLARRHRVECDAAS